MTLFQRCCTILVILDLHGIARAQLQELGGGSAKPVKAAHLIAELQAGSTDTTSGWPKTLALVLKLEPGWHVYWQNAGDSGEPPTVDWVLPYGLSIGPIQFPVPKRLPLGPLMDYGYEGTAVFPFQVSVASNPAGSIQHLRAHARWLVCREVCVPGRAFLGLDLPAPSAKTQNVSDLIYSAIAAEPQPLPSSASVRVTSSHDHFTMNIDTGRKEAGAEFYPFGEDVIRNAAEQIFTSTSSESQLSIERGDISDKIPARLAGVLKLGDGRAYLVDAPVSAASAPAYTSAQPALGLAFAILLAFAGGLVLNLMPCVFPVLFLKALALVSSSEEDRVEHRRQGLAYTLGILSSFWAIVAVLLVLRASGRQAGWGFQLQSPVFVVLMASLLFFMALSLAGQFDLGMSLTGTGDALTRKKGYAGSFFTGVLATVVATPCTAPLMGAAIGFALSQSPVITFAIFTSLAMGLALPYLALSLQPAWARFLPKPGRWMETLKQLTAVPLLLTVVWLVWVYGRLQGSGNHGSSGPDQVARLLVGLVVLAAAGWCLARWPAQRLGTLSALVLIGTSLAVSLSTPKADRLDWQVFSPAAIAQAQAQGRPVFVDFTAAWCLSCQVNEHSVLHDAQVERELSARHYVLLRADWTRYDPAITRQLASVDRSGVPTYVIYPATATGRVQVLPELLTRPAVLDAISSRGM